MSIGKAHPTVSLRGNFIGVTSTLPAFKGAGKNERKNYVIKRLIDSPVLSLIEHYVELTIELYTETLAKDATRIILG